MATVTPNRTDRQAGAANRAAVSNDLLNGASTLPAGVFYLDRAVMPTIAWAAALRGAGTYQTVLANAWTAAPYGPNLDLYPSGVCAGYDLATLVGDLSEGDFDVDYPNGGAPSKGTWLVLGDGPTVAQEFNGEFRRVAAASPKSATLDRPLRRTYAKGKCRAAAVAPVQNLTVADLTLAQPTNADAEPFNCKFVRALRLERVYVAGVSRGVLGLTAAWDCDVIDCVADNCLALGACCHDVRVRGGVYGSVYGEEGCHDVLLENVRVVCPSADAPPSFSGNGLLCQQGSERWTLRGVTVVGSSNMPLAMDGRGHSLMDVEVSGSRWQGNPYGNSCFLGGDGLRVVGLRSTGPVVIKYGQNVTLAHVRAPAVYLGWTANGVTTTASAGVTDCPNLIVGTGSVVL